MILLFIYIAIPVVLAAAYINLRRFRDFYPNQLPCLKVSLLFGHILQITKYAQRGVCKDRHFDYIIEEMATDLGNPPFLFLDVRPLISPLMIIRSPEIAEQITRASQTFKYSMPKAPPSSTIKAVMGAHSMVNMNGEDWRSMRKRYNPGFQPKYLQTLLPLIISHIKTFSGKLSRAAETGEVIKLGEYISYLTMDIIGAVTLDYDLRAQAKRENQTPAVRSLMDLLEWLPKGENPFDEINPVGLSMRYYYQRISDREVMKLVQGKANERKRREERGEKGTRSILNLSFEGVERVTPLLLDQTVDQIKTFFFAGHDTTASIVQWALYQLSLSSNRHMLDRIRAEHDTVFSTSNFEDVGNVIINAPEEILGKLVYTNAVIKEALRLFPPAGTTRMSYGENFTVEWKGKQICMDNITLYIPHYIIHRDKKIWGENANLFDPDRFIEGSASYRKVPDSAYRPFEKGPRNCIGQELAYLEAKAILALILRKFDFKKVGLDGVTEPEVYNVRQLTAKPVDGMRMQVFFAAE